MAKHPVGEEMRVRPAEPVEPVLGAFGPVAHPLELATRPPNDIDEQPGAGRAHPLNART